MLATEHIRIQNFYNLAYREEEREMNPYCADSNIALIPWSPLGNNHFLFRPLRSPADIRLQPAAP